MSVFPVIFFSAFFSPPLEIRHIHFEDNKRRLLSCRFQLSSHICVSHTPNIFPFILLRTSFTFSSAKFSSVRALAFAFRCHDANRLKKLSHFSYLKRIILLMVKIVWRIFILKRQPSSILHNGSQRKANGKIKTKLRQ